MATISEKRKQRFQFLNLVYETTDGNEQLSVNRYEIGQELGWTNKTTDLVVQYLTGEGLIEPIDMSGGIIITHFGVTQIEGALTHPEEPTTYFPAVINVMSGDFRGAILNVDSTLTNLSQSIGELTDTEANVKEELQQLINQLKQTLEKVPPEKVEEAEALAWAAETLIKTKTSEKPNRVKVEITKEGLKKAAKNIASLLPTVLPIAERIIEAIDQIKK